MLGASAEKPLLTDTRNIAIRIDLHRHLKALAATQGMTLRNLVEQLLIGAVEDQLTGLEIAPAFLKD